MTLLNWLRQGKTQKWVWVGLGALLAIQVYFVREMLAALLLFSIGFLLLATVFLALFLLDRGMYRALEWAGPHAARSAQASRRAWTLAEESSKKLLHHLRSETAR